MDVIASQLWAAKLQQKRRQRIDEFEGELAELNSRGILHSGAVPSRLFEKAIANLEDIALQWRSVYQDYWRRENPSSPRNEQERANEAIEKYFVDEAALIQTELARINYRKSLRWQDALLTEGKEKLAHAVAAEKATCMALVQGLLADTEQQRSRKRTEKNWQWLQLAGSLLVGGVVACLSAWLTNRGNRASLEPLVEMSMGEQNRLGMIEIASDTLHLVISNIGPTDVEDLRVYVNTFHGSFGLGKIMQDYLQSMPTFIIGRMKEGESRRIDFGNGGRFFWPNAFQNEENVYQKDPAYKGMLVYLKLHARYRRALDKHLFATTRIYYVTRTSLIPFDSPMTRGDFFSGQDR